MTARPGVRAALDAHIAIHGIFEDTCACGEVRWVADGAGEQRHRAHLAGVLAPLLEEAAADSEVKTLRVAAEVIRGNDLNDLRLTPDALLDALAASPERWDEAKRAAAHQPKQLHRARREDAPDV